MILFGQVRSSSDIATEAETEWGSACLNCVNMSTEWRRRVDTVTMRLSKLCIAHFSPSSVQTSVARIPPQIRCGFVIFIDCVHHYCASLIPPYHSFWYEFISTSCSLRSYIVTERFVRVCMCVRLYAHICYGFDVWVCARILLHSCASFIARAG